MKKCNQPNDEEVYLFHQGTYYQSYEYLGCHFGKLNSKKGAYFRVWAPNAKNVSVLGDFNDWNNKKNPLQKISKMGIWETFVEKVFEYQNYKFEIIDQKDCARLKSDPYGFFQETNGKTASIVYDLKGYNWQDNNYIENKQKQDIYSAPLNIYEVSFTSWKKQENGAYYTYKMYADELIPYLLDMGYTHVEIMPLNEYPFDGSWGYQVTGYFAITSRFGTPKDFMYFVDICHQNGIGVLLDWVPAHFPKDDEGLIEFDGKPLFENQGKDRMEHIGWGTRIFDFGRNEVQSFLISSAMLLLKEYHIDGLRVDAVASMLYLDYDKKAGEWIPNMYGDNKNLEAVAFIKKLNTQVFKEFPKALMIAEESTAWPSVTKPVSMGGLGFNFKWNMGWMNDSLDYIQSNPYFRESIHNKLTFSFYYAFSENYILPISHDEVVHGKKSLLDKMYGEYNDKFNTLRAYLCYMYAHPGKKLLFMGCEFGQFIEWNFSKGLDFLLLDYESHRKTKEFVKALNWFYLSHKEFYEIDYDWAGFSWIVPDDKNQNVLAFARYDKEGNEIVCVFNFSPIARENYSIGVNESGTYDEIFNSDDVIYGGSNIKNSAVHSKNMGMHGKKYSINIKIPPLSAIYFKRRKKEIKL